MLQIIITKSIPAEDNTVKFKTEPLFDIPREHTKMVLSAIKFLTSGDDPLTSCTIHLVRKKSRRSEEKTVLSARIEIYK